jgi:hypothetical protein
MMDRDGHLRLLQTTTSATTEEWDDEVAESTIPPNEYQRRLMELRAAEAQITAEMTASENGEGPANT